MTTHLLHDARAVAAAERLRDALAVHRIAVDVHDGYGLALVSVCFGLVVWCNGDWFWWCAGWDSRRRRFVYGSQQVGEVERAARRVAAQYVRLCERQAQPQHGAGSAS